MKNKFIQWDVVKFMQNEKMQECGDQVAVTLPNKNRFIFTIKNDCIEIHQTSDALDTIIITTLGPNKISIK